MNKITFTVYENEGRISLEGDIGVKGDSLTPIIMLAHGVAQMLQAANIEPHHFLTVFTVAMQNARKHQPEVKRFASNEQKQRFHFQNSIKTNNN